MYIIISLAIIGLMTQLLTNFTGFLMSILIMIIIAFVVFLIFNHFARNRMGGSGGFSSSPESKKYRDAVKRSQEKYGKRQTTIKKKDPKGQNKRERRRRRRRRATHLKVIKGNRSTSKEKDKDNRASF